MKTKLKAVRLSKQPRLKAALDTKTKCVRCGLPKTPQHICPDKPGGFLAPLFVTVQTPIPMIIFCPDCQFQHVDKGLWKVRPHRKHLCASCRCEFVPCDLATVGVENIKGFSR